MSSSNLLTDETSMPIKFFLQRDIPLEIQEELRTKIVSLGGCVEEKIPLKGFVLVQLGTTEEQRLRRRWTSSDRPLRYFQPYTYVEACKVAGRLLPQIFVDEGGPIRMHIHPVIANLNTRDALHHRIQHSGGDPCATEETAHVILVDLNTEVYRRLLKTYDGSPGKHIESYLWVKECIENNSVMYSPFSYKNPGGRRAGQERTLFTQHDDEKLCEWIAKKIPFKDVGGRTGNKLYQLLCEQIDKPEYQWVARHTWQSWRERYKKHAERLDKMIAHIVSIKNISPEMSHHNSIRESAELIKRVSKTTTREESDNLPTCASSTVVLDAEQDYLQVPGERRSTAKCLPAAQDANTVPTSEGDGDDDSSEWAVRIGNAPPPSWAKRKASDEYEFHHAPPSKKLVMQTE